MMIREQAYRRMKKTSAARILTRAFRCHLARKIAQWKGVKMSLIAKVPSIRPQAQAEAASTTEAPLRKRSSLWQDKQAHIAEFHEKFMPAASHPESMTQTPTPSTPAQCTPALHDSAWAQTPAPLTPAFQDFQAHVLVETPGPPSPSPPTPSCEDFEVTPHTPQAPEWRSFSSCASYQSISRIGSSFRDCRLQPP